MSQTVRAYAAASPTSPLAPFTFEYRAPRADDVVIDILYTGVCHSDLHTARNDWGGTLYPVIPGHEIVGRVKSVGSAVSNTAPATSLPSAAWSIAAANARPASTIWSNIAKTARPSPTTAATATTASRPTAATRKASPSAMPSC